MKGGWVCNLFGIIRLFIFMDPLSCSSDTCVPVQSMFQGLRFGLSTKRTRVLPCETFKLFVTLHLFTQLYERVPGYRQWWIFVRAIFSHALLHGRLLPREVEKVYDCIGSKV